MTTPITDVDAFSGFEISGSTRKIVISRGPTDVGISGIVDIVSPEFPEFTLGSTTTDLLSVAVSSVDSSVGSDSVSARTLGDTDSFSVAELSAQGTTVTSSDSAVGSESLVGRVIGVADSSIGFDNSSSVTVTGLLDLDPVNGTDLGNQFFSVTTLDSSVSTENQNVSFGTAFTSTDTAVLSENQSVVVALSNVDSSTLTDSTGNRSLVTTESSIISEANNRTVSAIDSSVGSDFGFVAITVTDNCVTTAQQISLPAISGTDSCITTDTNNKLAITTLNDWVVGADVIGSRAIIGFDSSRTSEVLGNRTLQSVEQIVTSDSGIHGNFVFSSDLILASASNNPPVYSPVATDTIVGADSALVSTMVPSTDVISLTDNQSFSVIVADSSITGESGVVTNVAIMDADTIVGTDVIKSRTFSALDQINVTEFSAAIVSIQPIESINTSDTSTLFVPIAQQDRVYGSDSADSLAAHIVDSNPIVGSESQNLSYRPLSKDTINLSENSSIVENPPNFNNAITVTDSGKGCDVATLKLVINNTQLLVMTSVQSVFARSSTTDSGISQIEQQNLTTKISSSDFVTLGESSSVIRTSTATDSILETDSQGSGPSTTELTIMSDRESVVEYVSLDLNVWAYGQVSVLQ